PSLCHAPAPSRAYPPPLRDALPIFVVRVAARVVGAARALEDDLEPVARERLDEPAAPLDHGHGLLEARVEVERVDLVERPEPVGDRKSTRLNSSHVKSSYAVFCLQK